MKQLALGVRLRVEAVFESFSPGQNGEILAALKTAAPGPLWLWGGADAGKTHLLQAACAAGDRAARDRVPGDRGERRGAAYIPLGRDQGLPPEALLGFESCGVLCVDDVDAVAGDLGWEEALFRLYNAAADVGTRLIFAAAAAPRALAWRLEDWRSRAAACVVYQLHELDDAGRIDALRLRAAQRGLELPQETADYLLRRLPRDLPTLFQILDRLDEASLVAQRRLTVPFIRAALERHAGKAP